MALVSLSSRFARLRCLATLVSSLLVLVAPQALAALGASVTLFSGDPSNIYPGESTRLQITLSNSNTGAAVSNAGFDNDLPGTLPNGLKVAGAASYSCIDPSGAPFVETGSLTAVLGSQDITLAGATIPARANSTDGTCTLLIPVTAGTSTGNAATYTYTIADGAVTGDDGAPVANTGSVSQSLNVTAISRPTISKSFSNSTAFLGGATRTLTITLTNSNPVEIPGFSVTDTFPQLGGLGIIKVAATPAASASCNLGGAAPTFNPVAGATSISATGTIPARSGATNGSCTLTVAIEGNHTNGSYSTGARTNTINASSDFSNDVGIPAASNATASITVTSPLGVTKAFSPSSLADGQTGTATITLSNAGDGPLTVTTFDDNPIDGVGNADNTKGLLVTGVATTCAGGVASILQTSGVDRGVRLAGGTIPAGGSCTVTADFTATTQAANTPVTYTNSLAEGDVGVTTPGIVSQSRSATILVADTLRVLKSNSGSAPRPGNPVRYTVTVQNWSTSDMANVRVLDTLSNGMTYLTGVINGNDYTPSLSGTGCSGLTTANVTGDSSLAFTVGTLPQRTGVSSPGACVISFYAMVSTAASNGSATTNSVAAGDVCTDNGAGICNGGGASSGNVAVTTPVFSATKAFSPAGPLSEGTVSRMTITLSNYSANPLTAVSISDTLPLAGSAQMQVANPANAATTCGAGTITAVAGSSSISLNGGTVPARAASGGVIAAGSAGSCTLQVDVVGAAGVYNNTATMAGNETYSDGSTHLVNASANASLTYTSSLSASKSFTPSAVTSGGRSTVIVRLGNAGSAALTGVAMTDPLPGGMVVASPANAYTTCAGSTTVTAAAGASSASLSGASIAGGGSCDLVFDVEATGASNWVNTIPAGNITADGGISNITPVSATLTYTPPTNLTVAKATNPSTLTFPGQVSQLTITLTNGSQAVTNLAVTDYFTQDGTSGAAANGMVIAPTPGASTTCPGGVVSATPGGTAVALTGASLSASASCTVTVNVTSTAVGGITNYIPASAIQTDQGLTNSGQATTSLTTQANIGVTKQFTPNVVEPGNRSRLRITFYNPTTTPMTSLSVTDTLPAGVTVPSGANPVTTCSGASLGSPAADQVQISGGVIPAASGGVAASCYAEIDVLVAAQGDYVNTIPAGAVTAVAGGAPASNSQPTSDTLRAKSFLEVQKAFIGKTLDTAIQTGSGFTTGSASTTPGSSATLTIRLRNPNGADLTAAAFTDTLPTGLVVATIPNASTTCASGTVIAPASGTSIRLTGATVPAAGACSVTVDVLSNIPGSYVNTLGAGDVTTFEGVTNEEDTSAELIVSTPPTVSKQFSPAVIPPGGTSTLTIFLGNDNASAITLSAILTDTLPTAPGNIGVAATPNVVKTCPGSVTAVAGAGTVSYASGASIPAGGCTISVDVTGTTPGTHNNNIPAGALQTNVGNNQAPANAPLTVSTEGYIAGRVFLDNDVVPDGSFSAGTDTPVQGASIELRSGATCAGALLSSTTTDVLGNYLFSALAAGTYSVCEPVQPPGTRNGITSAGVINTVNGSTGSAGMASNPTASTSQIVGVVLNGDGGSGEISGSAGNDFAEIMPSSISGTVFLDQNNNGVQNGADTALAGEQIDLLDGGGSLLASTTTDAAGDYSFTGLEPGTYSVRQPSQPAGTSNGLTTAGSVGNGGTAGTATAPTTVPSLIAGIILPPNTSAEDNDFAEIPQSRSLYGQVFLDFDNSGTENGNDHGIGGETINLTGTDINGNPVSRSTTTASDGSFSFTGLPEGTYALSQPAQPTGTSNGTPTAGTTGTAASNPTATSSQITGIDLTGGNAVSADNLFAEIPGAAPDLTLAKTHSPAEFAVSGTTGFYTLTPGNIGTVATSGTVTVTDTLPAGITPTAASGTGWTCGIAGQVVTCTSTTAIGAGATGNLITLNVSVAAGLSGQVLVNTAVISGGGEPPGFEGNNTASDPTPIAGSASVSGHVWRDQDHDRVLDGGEPLVSGWTVELLYNGTQVATTSTDVNGAYTFPGLAPGSGYQIRFREPTNGAIFGFAWPNEQGISPVAGTRDTGVTANTAGTNAGNPAGALVNDGTLKDLTLISGDNIVEQSLPLDPAGVVYDAITRLPVSGATVTLTSGGVPVPGACLAGGSNAQVTGVDGEYQFLLLNPPPGGQGCPGTGPYTLEVTQPGGYLPPDSTLIPPTAGPYVPTLGGVDAIQAQPTAPTGGDPTTWYTSFTLTLSGVPGTSSSNVVNNHIPLDPILGGAIVVTKTTPLVNVSKGDLVPYTITARNTLAAVLANIDLQDRIPPGFKYKSGSARLDGLAVEPTVNGRLLTWPGLSFTAGQTRTLKLILVVGAGVGEGEYTNSAWALNNVVNTQVSNTANATVRVVPDPLFDCSDLIGKVFDDKNANGYQDEGEPGIPNVRLATARGLLVTTDAEGRFHVTCAAVPQAQRGSNFIMKLDERTLPSGYRITTENPREVRMTRGKLVKLNFGAAIHRVVRLELTDAAFPAGQAEPGAALMRALEALPETLRQKPSVVRLAYQKGADSQDLAKARMKSVRQGLEQRWKAQGCCYTLQFEEEIFERTPVKKGGAK
ncbi:MAG: SdrD B-like domain-containing protein [Pseudomonadota bacterium]